MGPIDLQALQFTNVNEACSKSDRHNPDACMEMFVISTASGRQTMARRCTPVGVSDEEASGLEQAGGGWGGLH